VHEERELVFDATGLVVLSADAPMMRGDELVAALEAPGGGLAVGRRQLYQFEQGSWTAYPYSRESPRKLSVNGALFVGSDLFLVGDRGLLLRRRDARNFDRVVLDGLDPRTRGLDWLGAWATPSGHRLYVRAGYDRLLQIELESGHTRIFHVPRQGSGSAASAAGRPLITGRAGSADDEVLLVMGRGVYFFDGRELRPLASFDEDISQIAFAGPERVSVKVGDALVDLPLTGAEEDHVQLGALSPHDERALAAAQRREAYRRQQQQMLAADTFWFPTLRVAPGVQVELGDESFGRRESKQTHFAMDLGLGVLLAPPSGDKYERGHGVEPVEAWFWPELGYTWSPGAPGFAHAAFLGLGFGVGNDFVAGYYKPRGVLGFGPGEAGLAPMVTQAPGGLGPEDRLFPGLRHGLSAQLAWGTLGAEVSHGMVWADGMHHDLRFSLDVNLAPLIWAAILWGTL
jgi:hypothetical protein